MIYIKLLFFGLLIGGSGFIGLRQGQNISDAVCAKKEMQWMIDQDKLRTGYEEIIKSERIRQEENLLRVMNGKQISQAQLDAAMRNLADNGVYVYTGTCAGSDGLPGEAKGASKSGGAAGSGKVRLSGKSEKDILEIIKDAQEVTNKYNELRAVCLPLMEVVE